MRIFFNKLQFMGRSVKGKLFENICKAEKIRFEDIKIKF